MNSLTSRSSRPEAVGDYVAEMHLHMALHARKLVPTLVEARNNREQMLQDTQGLVEKIASRQMATRRYYE